MPAEHFSLHESIDAFLKPCGRFKSPLSWFDTIELKFLQKLSTSRVFHNIVAFPNYNILPNWQILLNYLVQQGILSEPSFALIRQRNDFPHMNRAALFTHVSSECTDGREVEIRAYGSGRDLESAYSKAVGELLERYIMTLYRTAHLRHNSYNDMRREGTHTLNLDMLPKFLPWQIEQFPEFSYSNDTPLNWVKTTELISQKRAYIPAQLVFWSYNRTSTQEPWLQHATTNGEAGNFTFEESILSSIYELVERDALLIFWLNTLSPPRIKLETINDTEIQARIASVVHTGLKLYYLDTTSDLGIPSCTCVIVDDRGVEPRLALGGSAGFDAHRNFISSLNEALSVAQHNVVYTLPADYKPFQEQDVGREERMAAWHGKEMLERFNFFIAGKEVVFEESRMYADDKIFSSKKDELGEVQKIFKHKGEGYELYSYTASHPALDKLGYMVTKVVIPKLVPLHLKEHLATLGAERLHEVPKTLGYAETKLNPWPHPFS